MVDLRLLGSVELRGEAGDGIGLGAPQQRCLLAVLAMSPGRTVTMDSLVDRVWDRRAPHHVRDVVYTYVSRLRRVFRQAGAPTAVRRADGGYLLDIPADQVDLHRGRALARRARDEGGHPAVELLREATGLWRGTPLTGVPGDWAARTRAGLVQERVTLLTERFGAELETGRRAEVVEELSGAVVEHPLAEPLTALLMRALSSAGRQADALAAYEAIRRRLREELGEEPGSVLRELHLRILRRDPELDRHDAPRSQPLRAAVGTVDRPAVRPAQLPPDVTGFAGRDEEMGCLDSLSNAATETASTCVVVGTAGIGKTTLAVHWAHGAAGRFPDGQLYVNLRGFDPSGTAVEPDQALRGFLEAFGVREEQFPSGTDGLSALFRSLLADQRVLMVLDNARDLEQIRPLLPAAPGCLTLVTSRHQLPGLLTAGATQLGLQLFGPGEARQLLVHRLGPDRLDDDPGAVDEIVARCAGLPLALAVVAAHAAARPGFPLRALTAELCDEDGLPALYGGDAATDIRAVFSWSYHALSPEAARVFRLTGLHAGPDLGLGAAAHLAGLPRPRTRALLAELTRASLLSEHAPGRFSSHDLLRTYAAELAGHHDSAPARHAALTRILDYYLHSAHTACLATGIHLYMETPGPPLPATTPERFTDAARAVEWFTAERRALAAAVGLAARSGLDAYAVQLSRRLCTYLDRQGHWHEQTELLDSATQAAARLGDPVEEARGLADLARSCIRSERFEQAHHHLKQALVLFEENKDTRGRARVHNYCAYLHELHGAYDEALRHSLRVLELERAAGNPSGVARALNSVGWRHVLRGDHGQALAYLREALALQKGCDDRYGAALTLDSLGLAYHHMGDWQRATDYYQRALRLLQSPAAADRLTAATTLARLGDTHRSAGEPAAARDAWQRALRIFDELRHPGAEQLRARLVRIEALPVPPGSAG
ncbi:AfsR/SARP family transcriptional regulator [Streptomyces sp. MAR4 CNX-425]|uniref:AfsR/SARP family transcriptional regulator n=1 Tax=Streptomyces sp. MAR4 CNX-425 TaxID=3406343 RepID=UPI003B5127BA